MAKTKPATNLAWRTFFPHRHSVIDTGDRKDLIISNTTILQAQVLGPCIIREKRTKDRTSETNYRTIQRVELNGIETPNVETYLAIHTTDTLNRQLIFIIPPTLDKYLLALPRSGLDNITITNEEIIFTQSRDHNTHLVTTNISQADLDLLKLAMEHWNQ